MSGSPRLLRHRPAGRQGQIAVMLLLVCALAAALGGVWWWYASNPSEEDVSVLTHTVALDEFVLEITERGDIESSDDVEVRCAVKSKNTGGTAILRVVSEGTKVAAGDFLVQLDSSQLEEDRTTQKIMVNSAEAVMIEARNLHETAVIALQEYVEGTFEQEKKTAEGEIFVAEENLSRAEEYLNYSKKLAAKGHITEQQLKADRFAVEKAAKELEVAQTKLYVLEKFTRQKMVKQLESDIATTKAKWSAMQNSFELEQNKLAEIEDQIEKCHIVAPTDGTVVYAHDRDYRGGDEFVIEEGTLVRERQTIIRLPNAAQMQVVLKINESLIKFVKAGLRAAVLPIGFETPITGEVTHVNQYAEPQNWRRPDVREYRTTISVDSSAARVRSGMTAAVTIECAYLPDVIKVPVQCVHAHGAEFYCFVQRDERWEARRVERGPTNDKFFVVEDGLDEGDRVALAPRKVLDLVELPRIDAEKQQQVVRDVPLPEEGRVALNPATQATQSETESGKPKKQPQGKQGGPLAGNSPIEISKLASAFQDAARKFDGNQDGQLDATEKAAARKAIAAARGGKPASGAGQ